MSKSPPPIDWKQIEAISAIGLISDDDWWALYGEGVPGFSYQGLLGGTPKPLPPSTYTRQQRRADERRAKKGNKSETPNRN